jgi:hypothetical protein
MVAVLQSASFWAVAVFLHVQYFFSWFEKIKILTDNFLNVPGIGARPAAFIDLPQMRLQT